jgi:hypothetical protein
VQAVAGIVAYVSAPPADVTRRTIVDGHVGLYGRRLLLTSTASWR